MIAIIDYGSGNVAAIANIYAQLRKDCVVTNNFKELERASHLILPGVGAFDETISNLQKSGLKSLLDELVIIKKTPILGVCVGMQILASESEEGQLKGLDYIPGKVRLIDKTRLLTNPKLPHMGWNSISPALERDTLLFEEINTEVGFYFLHSYYFDENQSDFRIASVNYGYEFTCAVRNENIFGVQFHPEKSHANGIKLLKNFSEYLRKN